MMDIKRGKSLREPIAVAAPGGTFGGDGVADAIDDTQHEQQHNYHCYDEANNEGLDLCGMLLYLVTGLFVIVTFPVSLWFCIRVITQFERGIIFRLGKLNKRNSLRLPGVCIINPCIDTFAKVDLRITTYDVPPQEILTRDSVTVAVDAVAYYRVFNPLDAIVNVTDYNKSTKLLAQTTLRNILGTKDLAQLLSEREEISQLIQTSLEKATDNWGVRVERVEVKDVRLPLQMQRAMAAEAEASREARAKFIAANGEQKACVSLKEASDVMAQSPYTLQLRYLQTLNTISAEKNSTIIFPLPLEFLKVFQRPSSILGGGGDVNDEKKQN